MNKSTNLLTRKHSQQVRLKSQNRLFSFLTFNFRHNLLNSDKKGTKRGGHKEMPEASKAKFILLYEPLSFPLVRGQKHPLWQAVNIFRLRQPLLTE